MQRDAKKASSNRDVGKSEEYTRTRAVSPVRERNPPLGKTTRKKREVFKGRKVEYRASSGPRNAGGPLASSAWILGNIVRVCVCVCVCVCVMRARVSVCKNTEEEEEEEEQKKEREKRISSQKTIF